MTIANTMWSGRRVLVTGGTSFIGSTLVDQLLDRGARIRIVDDLTSGRIENIQGHLSNGKLEFIQQFGSTVCALGGRESVISAMERQNLARR